MKAIILSDIHIRNNVRHDEYVEYFEYIKNIILDIKPDYAFFCGDLFNSKTTLSPDSFQYAYQFLRILGICTNTIVIVLAGNHDMNEHNLDKLDAISPLFEHLDHKQYYYCKEAKDIHFDENIRIRPYPLSDKGNWKFDRSEIDINDIVIGLYHGPLNGVKTDMGFTFSNGMDVKEFYACNYLFCGDIHSRMDYLEDRSKISVGNPIQQDFGEDILKGMWLYDITSQTVFTRRFIQIPNFYPFITLQTVYPIIRGDLPFLPEAKGIRFRIYSDKSHEETQEFVRTIRDVYKDRIKTLTVSRVPLDNLETSISKILTYEDYIKNNKNKVKLLELYNKYIKEVEYVSNTNNWKIKEVSWINLFGYEEDNCINFKQNFNKAIGVFGKNYSGKTSIIDVICFGLFGSWTKEFVPLINFINDKKAVADVSVSLQINNKVYNIYRKLERVGKTCKSTLIFANITDSIILNEIDVKTTQKCIEGYIGTKSQFLLTSLSTQYNNFSLLTEKNTKRKEYFSAFLGINKYEQIYKLVKDDIKDIKQSLEYTGNAYNYIELSNELIELTESFKKFNNALVSVNFSLKELSNIDKSYYEEIKRNKEKKYNIDYKLMEHKKKLANVFKKREAEYTEIVKDVPKLENITDNIMDIRASIKELSNRKVDVLAEIRSITTKQEQVKQSRILLSSVPCGTQFLQCRFIVNSKDGLEFDENLLIKTRENCEDNLKNISGQMLLLEQQLSDNIGGISHNMLVQNIIQKNEIIAENIKKLNVEEKTISDELEIMLRESAEIENTIAEDLEIQKRLEEVDKKELALFKQKIEIEGTIQVIKYKKESIEVILEKVNKDQLQLKYLEDFAESVGKNGIIISILNEYVPAIVDFVNNILSNFVPFSIKIEIENDKDVEIYITDSFSSRLIETGSGSQLTIISYALRMALLHYGQIPSCDLIIMDEPATSLDADLLLDFSKLLDMIKLNNKTILLVTHIMMLKDFMDVSLIVDKSSGYSKILT